MKIAICEDDIFWREKLKDVVEHWAENAKQPLCLKTYPNSESFWFAFLEEKDWDIILLDIEMGQENGMELAKRIRAENEEVVFIFTTGYAQYMPLGYDVGAMQYLLKPINEKKLSECLEKVVRRQKKQERKFVFETVEQIKVSLSAAKIWYLEAFRHNCFLYTKQECYEIKKSIAAAAQELEKTEEFVKCHRSYIVNLRYVREIRREEITLDDGRKLPISRSAFKKVNETFLKFYRKTD